MTFVSELLLKKRNSLSQLRPSAVGKSISRRREVLILDLAWTQSRSVLVSIGLGRALSWSCSVLVLPAIGLALCRRLVSVGVVSGLCRCRVSVGIGSLSVLDLCRCWISVGVGSRSVSVLCRCRVSVSVWSSVLLSILGFLSISGLLSLRSPQS